MQFLEKIVSCPRIPGGFGQLMHLNSPSETFMFKEQEVSSTANVLAAAGMGLIAEICEEVDGMTSWIQFFLKYLKNVECTISS
jgi:hypothetical protein